MEWPITLICYVSIMYGWTVHLLKEGSNLRVQSIKVLKGTKKDNRGIRQVNTPLSGKWNDPLQWDVMLALCVSGLDCPFIKGGSSLSAFNISAQRHQERHNRGIRQVNTPLSGKWNDPLHWNVMVALCVSGQSIYKRGVKFKCSQY